MKIHRKKLILGVSIAIIIVFAMWFLGREEPTSTTYTAARKNVTEEVLLTGTVTSKQSVNLAFEKSGRIQTIYVYVGKAVGIGDLLVTQERGNELASLQDARAVLLSKEARLAELKRGTRIEEIQVTEAKLKKAEQSVIGYEESIQETIDSALTKAETAVYQYTENLFSDDRSTAPQLTFYVTDTATEGLAETGRITAEAALNKLRILKDSTFETRDDSVLDEAKTHLFTIQNFLIAVTNAINHSTLNDSTKVTYKTDVATARKEVNTALDLVTALNQSLALAKAERETAARQLALERAGTSEEIIAQAEADVESAKASVSSAEAALRQRSLFSPISGMVTDISADPGEITAANTAVVTVINTNAFEIEAYLPEADIAKVQKGQDATVTLDAYGSTVTFNAKILSINPASTLIEGVPTYKTILAFTEPDERIKSGMTANITITTAEQLEAVTIPERAILFDEDGPFVYKKSINGTEKIPVKTGLRGMLGDIEITEGVVEGDEIIIGK